ncbi:Hypothetical protein NTJ_14148 [Nesidiocoris tenuis]|uniref:Uncharacterized protein n=1 Tax=Nesidiocoris tenuis TaxID=355587 RepID=A0ABN7BAD5_9HEMI|nr:Hypothetical protein NTJ_14148 [Nesidiocoris tenuis]
MLKKSPEIFQTSCPDSRRRYSGLPSDERPRQVALPSGRPPDYGSPPRRGLLRRLPHHRLRRRLPPPVRRRGSHRRRRPFTSAVAAVSSVRARLRPRRDTSETPSSLPSSSSKFS